MPSPSLFRRLFSVFVLLAIACGPLVVSNAASAAPLAPPGVPTTGAYFGSSATVRSGETKEEAILRTEAQIGRTLAVDRQFYRWDHVLPTAHASFDVAGGRIPFFSWKPQRRDGSMVAWTRINSGVEDAWIAEQADRVRDFGHPVFMAFNHEPYDQSKEGWGTPADFVAAWRRIVDTFRARGATNVAWVLVLTSGDYRQSGRPEAFYPGDGYVDWLAADPYNWYSRDGFWSELSDKAEAFYTWGSAKAKPLMLAEWGSEEDPDRPGRKAQWFDNASAWLKTRPNIKAVVYFNSTVDHNWYIDTSASSLAAFSAMGADPYFNPVLTATTTTTAPTTTTTTPVSSADPYTPIGTFPFSEGSGIVASRTQPGVFWVQRDSGNPSDLYATRIVDGNLADVTPGSKWKTVKTDAGNSDWEDIGIDNSGRIYIHERGGSKVYRFGEVDVAGASSTTRQSTLSWDWPSNSHDSESLFWWNDSVYIVDKRPCSPHALYRRSTSGSGTETLAHLGEIVAPPVGWVEDGDCAPATAADVSFDGKRVAIATERRVWVYEGTNPEDAVKRAPKWSVTHRADGSKEQVEAVAFAHNSYDMVTLSETGGRIRYIPGSYYGPTATVPTTTTTTTTAPTTTTTTTVPPAPSNGPIVFSPVADARVVKSRPNKNYGKSSTLMADNSPQTETFVRFDVTGLEGAVTSARLRLYATDPSKNGPEVYPAASTWTETGITWNNRPARTGALLDDAGSVAKGAYTEWDVTDYVTGNGAYSLNLVADSSDGADFKSRQTGSNRPELVVETGVTSP